MIQRLHRILFGFHHLGELFSASKTCQKKSSIRKAASKLWLVLPIACMVSIVKQFDKYFLVFYTFSCTSYMVHK